MQDAFNVLRAGGRSIVVGLPAYTEMLEIPAIMLLREKSIKGSVYGSSNPRIYFQKIASLGENGQLNFDLLVDRSAPFPKSTKALPRCAKVS